ncbi:MAG: beta-galactosidase trimerization domain-containing protein [Pirellulales bacterium]
MDNALSTASHVRTGWLKTLEDLGYQAKFLHRDHLLNDALINDGYKVLILGRTLCLSDEEALAIRVFAAAGGTVITDHQCGLFDEHGQARPRGALDDLFGVKRQDVRGWFDGQSLTEVDGERGGTLDDKTWLGTRSSRVDDMTVVELGLRPDGAVAAAQANDVPVLLRKIARRISISRPSAIS